MATSTPASTADFDGFYRATAARVIHLVYASTGDLGLAQDCTQEAYARAWQQWETLSERGEPLAWVRTVARRLAISQWRKQQSEQRSLTRSHSPAVVGAHTDQACTAVLIHAALGELPAEQREVLALFYLQDLSLEQICAELNAPVGTVKARLHRGRRALARRLGGDRSLLTVA